MAAHFCDSSAVWFYLSLFDNARANLSDRLRICSGPCRKRQLYNNFIWLVSSDPRGSRIRVDDRVVRQGGSVIRTPSEAEATARASRRFSAAACRSTFFIPLALGQPAVPPGSGVHLTLSIVAEEVSQTRLVLKSTQMVLYCLSASYATSGWASIHTRHVLPAVNAFGVGNYGATCS